jgi:polysaccharide chain length determinant protein (PEP-CTERM system associated)
MRNDLSVETPPIRRGITPGYFQVSYIHLEPSKAMLAVSKLVTLFIEESLWIREQQASGTTSFIEDELVKLKKVLEEQEEAVREYKRTFMGELPDQLDANLRMLDNLQLQLSDNLESQRETRDQMMLLEREISRMEGEIKVATSLAMEAETETMTNSTVNQLIEQANTLRQQIANMEVTYTEKHPDLIAAKKELAGLEQKLRAVSDTISSSQETNTPGVISLAPTYSLEMANFRRQLNAMKPQVSSLRREEKDLRKKIQQYQQRIEAAPEREQNLIQLTRDYENTKTSYEDLLNKKLEAQLSENLEKRQKGANFQVVDPANFPERPFLPNRKKIIGMGFVGGLGVGIGLIFLLDMLFPVFSSLKQLQDVSEFNINFGIPYISSAAERRRRMINAIVFGCAFLVAFFLSMALVDQYVFDLEMFKRTIIANLKGII